MRPSRPSDFSLLALSASLGGALLAAAAMPASAQPWADCTQIESDRERLACFDAVAGGEHGETRRDDTPGMARQSVDADEPIARQERDSPPEPIAPVTRGEHAGDTPRQTLLPAKADSDAVALENRLSSERSDEQTPFTMRSYKPNYILPATYTPTDLSRPVYDFEPQQVETKFQLSFQFDWWDEPLGPDTSLYFAYSQLSLWQTYNNELLDGDQDNSSPFRETNHEPEAGLSIDMEYKLAGLTFRRTRLSFIHASNGQGGDRSRSWNRLAASVAFGRGNFAGRLRGWYRVPERNENDNPDITDYMGHGDLLLAYKWKDQTLSATLRNNLQSDNRGAIQIDYSFPLNKRVKGYVQYFNGYGESLIDYNRSVSRIGVGIALTDWL